mgnify:CR=1 FL=1
MRDDIDELRFIITVYDTVSHCHMRMMRCIPDDHGKSSTNWSAVTVRVCCIHVYFKSSPYTEIVISGVCTVINMNIIIIFTKI